MTDKQVALRLDEDLLTEIDARARDVGLSRNEWVARCTRWAIHNLPYGASGPVRTKASRSAPDEVAGAYSVDMGLDNIEGKRP